MTQRIDAILFDMGGTLRGSVENEPSARREAVLRIAQLTGIQMSLEDLDVLLSRRSRAYVRWARRHVTELDEQALWTCWMLPDQPPELIGRLAVQLNQLWRTATGVRNVFPETKEVALELFRRGYRLGLVSNTTSSVEVPHLLRELDIAGCFEVVLLSCQIGLRKPDPRILLEAARRMGMDPQHCAYVGDRYDRDLPAAREAGFSSVVIIGSSKSPESLKAASPCLSPDHSIRNLRELLDIFPPREEPEDGLLYHASLSTMWARHNSPSLPDFVNAAHRLGFSHVELNHQVDSSMLDGLHPERWPVSSIHEPCPADISTDDLKGRDWLISSPDEECRRRGVEAIRRSVDLAASLRLPVMVVHCGMVSLDFSDEKKLRRMLEAGEGGSPAYQAVQERMRQARAALIAPRLDSVRRSLLELLEMAAPVGLRLGLENRFHFFDIPSPDEMEELLALAPADRLGFVYDVGHAQVLDRMGFYPYEEWLHRFAPRMIETHLHDVNGVTDHLAPGLGDVNFERIAPFLPAGAVRTLELHPSNTPAQVRSALKYLAGHGCIQISAGSKPN